MVDRRPPPLIRSDVVPAVRRSLATGVGGESVERQLTLVALAKQHAESPLPVTAIPRRVREAPAQGGERGLKLGLLVGIVRGRLGKGAIGQSPVDATGEQSPLDALTPPLLKFPLVGDEQPGEPLVVEEALLGDGLDGRLAEVLGYPLALELRPDFADGVVAAVDVRVGEGERALKLLLLGALPSHDPRRGAERSEKPAIRSGFSPSPRGGAPTPPVSTGLCRRRDGGQRRVVVLDLLDEVPVEAERRVDLALNLVSHLLMLVEERLGVAAALAEPLVAVGEERTGLGDDVVLDPVVEQAAGGGDPLAELDVKLGLLERGRDLVLDDLHPDPVTDGLGAVLERLDPPDVQALGGVELQRAPTRLGLRGAEHDAHLLPDLVGEQ